MNQNLFNEYGTADFEFSIFSYDDIKIIREAMLLIHGYVNDECIDEISQKLLDNQGTPLVIHYYDGSFEVVEREIYSLSDLVKENEAYQKLKHEAEDGIILMDFISRSKDTNIIDYTDDEITYFTSDKSKEDMKKYFEYRSAEDSLFGKLGYSEI